MKKLFLLCEDFFLVCGALFLVFVDGCVGILFGAFFVVAILLKSMHSNILFRYVKNEVV